VLPEDWAITPDEFRRIRTAALTAGALEHAGIDAAAITEFCSAIAWFLGGSLDSIDAFLAQEPDTDAGEHRVLWLRGTSLGSLTLKTHSGPGQTANVVGCVRSLDRVTRIEVHGIGAEWSFSRQEAPKIRPDVSVHFDDEVIAVRTSERKDAAARAQACQFVSKLLEVVAARP